MLRRASYYVTTPIFYVNASPHIGHLHSQLLADVYARFNRLRQPTAQTVLCTGTDEHGGKIDKAAKERGLSPIQLCDDVSQRFRELAKKANVDNQVFIRTTEARHAAAVTHVWRELFRRGHIYKSTYAGYYSVSDEAYYPSNAVHRAEGSDELVSTETGSRVEWMSEDTWKFRLSSFREPITAWIAGELAPVQPPSRTSSLLAQLQVEGASDFDDLSVSRPRARLEWGIPVPDDSEGNTIYVWIDALVNYLTAVGYPWSGGSSTPAAGAHEYEGAWPADVMVVGKDILRFHAIYFPALLLALDLPLPRRILCHGHWTMDRAKMSKSRGNVADPIKAMDSWGVDAVRVFLMRQGGNPSADADWSEEELARFYKKELAGQIGNFVSRILTPKVLKKLPASLDVSSRSALFEEEFDGPLLGEIGSLADNVEAALLVNYNPAAALAAIFDVLATANKHYQGLEPWMNGTSAGEVARAWAAAFETLRVTAVLLQPFMPDKSNEILDRLGLPASEREGQGWEYARLGGAGVLDVAKLRERLEGKKKLQPLFPQNEATEYKPPSGSAKKKAAK